MDLETLHWFPSNTAACPETEQVRPETLAPRTPEPSTAEVLLVNILETQFTNGKGCQHVLFILQGVILN